MQVVILAFFCLMHDGQEKITVPYLDMPLFAGDSQNEFWLGDYKQGVIYRVHNGESELIIDYGSGQGPGEFKTARNIFYFRKHNVLVVIGKSGLTQSFQADDGQFIKKLIAFEPFDGAVQWDDESFLFAWSSNDPRGGAAKFRRYRFDGVLLDSWFVEKKKFNQGYIYDAYKGFAFYDSSVLIGYAAEPKVFIANYKQSKTIAWSLKPPVGYIEPPSLKLSRNDYSNFDKLNDYLNSFSFMQDVFIVDGKFLLVLWHVQDLDFSYDVYDVEKRKIVVRNARFNGWPIGFVGKKVLLHEDYDQDVEFEDSIQLRWHEIPGLGGLDNE